MSRPLGIPHHHSVVSWVNPNPPPTGKCLYWQVIDGKAQQCGKRCEGQRCEAHKGHVLTGPLDAGRERGLIG